MPITIKKQIHITVDGDDVQTLKDVCELARRFMQGRMHMLNGAPAIAEYNAKETQAISSLMEKIFNT